MLAETIEQWIISYGYISIFGLLMFGILGVPVPDETMLALSGYLVKKGTLSFLPTLGAAFLGSICGNTLSYGIGRLLGKYLIRKYGIYIRITDAKLLKVEAWFEHSGRWLLIIGYYIPGVRHLVALVAGSSKMDFHIFAVFAYTGGFIWSITFISLGYFVGAKWAKFMEQIHHHAILFLGILLMLGIIYLFIRWKTGWLKKSSE